MVRLDGPSAEGQAETQAGSIGAALLERTEQVLDVPPRKAAAFVLDLDEHALGAGADPQRDGGRGRVNLKAFCSRFITTAARTCRSASIATPSSTGITVSVTPRALASSVAAGASSSMNSETRNRSGFWTPCVRRTSASERPTSDRDSHEAAMEHGPGAPGDADISRLEHLEREDRGVDQVPQLMRQEPEALAPARGLSVEPD